MSRDDYEASAALARDHSTGALLMALMRRTGPGHEPKYAALFPLTWLEFNRRQGFPGGMLPEEAEARSIPPLRLVATPPPWMTCPTRGCAACEAARACPGSCTPPAHADRR